MAHTARTCGLPLAMISEPLEKMPTSLEALSNEHLQEQATKARFAARILHAYFLAQRGRRAVRSQPVVAPIKIGHNEPYYLCANAVTNSAVCIDTLNIRDNAHQATRVDYLSYLRTHDDRSSSRRRQPMNHRQPLSNGEIVHAKPTSDGIVEWHSKNA